MGKLLTIAFEEIAYHLRQWTFLLTVLTTLVVFGALGALPQMQQAAQASPLASVETVFTVTEELTVPTGYVDHAGLITVIPADQAAHFRKFESEGAAAAALDRGDVESYYVIAADYVQTGTVVQYSIEPQLLTGTDDAIKKLIRENLLHSLADPALAGRLAQPLVLTYQGPPLPVFNFVPADLDVQRLLSAGLVIGLFAVVINVGGNLLLRALQREVRAGVLELLVASTTSAQFIGGKLLGLAALALGQTCMSLLVAVFVYGRNPDGSGPAAIPGPALALCLPYLLLGYLAYCGAVMGAAALWPNLPESSLLLAAARLVALSPLLGAPLMLPRLDGPLAVGLTLLPLTSPLLMPFRLLLGAVPGWQWGLGLLLLAGWAGLSIWTSIRLFRAHNLLTGRLASPRMIWQALRQ